MSKVNWHKRLQEILKNDIKVRPKALDELKQAIINNIHGNININTKAAIELLNSICEQFKNELGNIELEVTESTYNNNKDKGLDTQFLYGNMKIQGIWNGYIHFKTSSGTKSSTGEPIYYIMYSDFKIISYLEEKIKNYYIDTYETMVEEEFLNLAVDKDLYLRLKTKRNEYELWDREPSDYSDTMSGDYCYSDRYNSYSKTYDIYKTLKKIRKFNKVSEFIENKLGDRIGYTTETVEWRNYYI